MDNSSGEENLLKLIEFGIKTGLIVATLAVLTYAYYFGFYLKTGLSTNPAAWGAFGDYMGGLLNPAVAFFAFLLLAKSVQIQSKELRETSEALRQASDAQGDQVAVQRTTAIMNALSTAISSLDQRILILSREHHRIAEALSANEAAWVDGASEKGQTLIPHELRLRESIEGLEFDRRAHVHALNSLRTDMVGREAPCEIAEEEHLGL